LGVRREWVSSNQEPSFPFRGIRAVEGISDPFIGSGAFGSVSTRKKLPGVFQCFGNQHPNPFCFPSNANRFLRRNAQGVGMFLLFQPHSQTVVTDINRISCHQFDGQACLKGTLQHLTCQLGVWCKIPLPQEHRLIDNAGGLRPSFWAVIGRYSLRSIN
jgi:hypothetical protein